MSATASNLIDETWIRQNTSISNHVDITLISPFIPIAQDILFSGCKGLFGDALYSRLCQGNILGDLNANEIYLLELSRPALAWYICHISVGEIATQIRGSGVGRVKNDHFDAASREEVQDKSYKYKNFSEFYSQKVINYLEDNGSSYPEYSSTPKKETYKGGIYFGSKGSGCRRC